MPPGHLRIARGRQCELSISSLLLTICWSLFLSQGCSALRLPSLSLRHAVRRPKPTRQEDVEVSARAATLTPAAKKPTDFADGDDVTVRNHWALLVAGSAGWGNYRHQADVCHAYQVLLRGGLRPAHIVTMMYDDIAHDPENPYPGHVFNSPGGPDVYGGVRVDYRGSDVSAAVFLAVLEGNASALPPGTRGSGRVLASGPYDRLFVFYSDHGAPGVLGMPSGSFLYADELVGALQRKWRHRGYKEAVLYIEACESGSMFEGLLPPDIGAYATTASNAMESSWGTYCPGMSPGPPPLFSTCLGDLYSVAWMENADVCDLTQETLMAQYSIIRNRTSNNYTYSMGSHVMQYGSLAITRESTAVPGGGEREQGTGGRAGWLSAAGAMLGSTLHWARSSLRGVIAVPLTRATGSSVRAGASAGGASGSCSDVGSSGEREHRQQQHRPHPHMPQRDADLAPLRHAATHAVTSERRAAAAEALAREQARRQSLDQSAVAAAASLLQRLPALAQEVAPLVQAVSAAAAGGRRLAESGAEAGTEAGAEAGPGQALLTAMAQDLVYGPVRGRRRRPEVLASSGPMAGGVSTGQAAVGMEQEQGAAQPLVDDWDCLRAMVAAWSDSCGPMAADQYVMRHTRLLARLCNAQVPPALVAEALRGSGCSGANTV
eukprot:XP_001703162.1 vacuolar processing enzyme [Chlamydomonas reinhardtii]